MSSEIVIENLTGRAAVAIPVESGDYVGKDGLLYCGHCNTKKQTRIEILGKVITPLCMCACMAAAREAEEAERRRRTHQRRIAEMRSAGFPESDMHDWTFDRDDGKNQKISAVAHNYADNFQRMLDNGNGLLLYGSVGTGKTFFAACIANALIDRGYPCLMTNFPRLVNTLYGMQEGRQAYIDGLNRFALLVIDDLAAERDTEYMNEIVQTIIDCRYRAALPTIITTNLTADEIKNPADIRKKRTFSRLLEMCIPVEVQGKDRRRAKLLQNYTEMADMLGL